MKIYIARQPIFTREKRIYGYELLFRDGMENMFPDIGGSSATSRVLSNTFFSSDIQHMAGGHRAFINFTKEMITRGIAQLFPPDITTIEILEDIEPDESFIECCRELSNMGYQIALDDFQYREGMDKLIDLADIIKVDFLSTSREKILEYVRSFSSENRVFLAEKIETHDQFRLAYDLGFSYFQGYFFSKPEILKKTEIPTLRINLIQIMSEAESEEYRIKELVNLIERDVGISYKLMRCLNSPFYRRMTEITSIKHAIMLLGEKGLKSFLSIIIMSELSQDKPDELLKNSVLRARFCENLGKLTGRKTDPSELFTLGLFSLIDAILDSPMDHVMEQLPLAREIKAALIEKNNALSLYLKLVQEYERGNWEEISLLSSSLGIDMERLPEIYLEGLSFADALIDAADS